jgi:UDPglucose 6-dehydrogenase/UDP-N-acetyl-D-galactosamine dehydrogenase
MLMDKLKQNEAIVCIVGLGYVGLPLAIEFSKSLKVIGFDIDDEKIKELNNNPRPNILFTNDPKEIGKADFVIIAVPTPVTKSKEPDLSYIKSASKIVSENLKRGSVVILESTFYPGVTEEIVKPMLEEKSGLKCGKDFKIAYSPERINPGDDEHALRTITKVVSGIDEETTEVVAELYKKVTSNIFKAKSIKIAEAAKVIENIQRDLNIALMNELSLIFERMGLSTRDVIETAATKWNFHRYYPGLVGGHCIPVDPYYLVHKAEELDYHPKVILSGRDINDYMPKHVAEITIKALNDAEKVIKRSKVLVMGLTYKENVRDTRESPARRIIKELKEYGVEVFGYDPLVDDIRNEFGIEVIDDIKNARNIDCVILTVAHDIFREITLDELKKIMNDSPIIVDLRGIFDEEEVRKKGFCYRCL